MAPSNLCLRGGEMMLLNFILLSVTTTVYEKIPIPITVVLAGAWHSYLFAGRGEQFA
jgi:hypothetical protein